MQTNNHKHNMLECSKKQKQSTSPYCASFFKDTKTKN